MQCKRLKVIHVPSHFVARQFHASNTISEKLIAFRLFGILLVDWFVKEYVEWKWRAMSEIENRLITRPLLTEMYRNLIVADGRNFPRNGFVSYDRWIDGNYANLETD